MSSGTTWIIGAGSECDVVIDRDTVSARHCRLTWTAPVFFLEDLDSSNGTFINGERVLARTPVTRADQISLGLQIPMPWPDREIRGIEDVVTIGRDSDNDIVLNEPMVSARHAQLIVAGGQTFLQDAGSTNGVAVGLPEHTIKRAEVSTNEIVYFGTLAISVRELLNKAMQSRQKSLSMDRRQSPHRNSESTAQTQLPKPRGRQSSRLDNRSVIAATIIVGSLLVGIAGIQWIQMPAMVGQPDNLEKSEDPPLVETNQTVQAMTPQAELLQSVYAVLLTSEDQQQVYQIGTAWAVSPKHLATSASVVLAIEELRSNLNSVLVRNPVTKAQHYVSARAHPRFVELTESANQIEATLHELDKQFTKAVDATEKQTLEARLQEIDRQLVACLRETMYFDVGVLEVRQQLPHHLPQSTEAAVTGQRLRLVGTPFPIDEQLLNPDRPLAHRELVGQMLVRLRNLEQGIAPVVFNAPTQDVEGQQWSGAPILNAADQVVGIFSRLSPPDFKAASETHQLRPHATDVRVLREMIGVRE